MRMLLKDFLTASEHSHDVLPASESLKRMNAHPDMPMAKPIQALIAPNSPANPSASMRLVPPRRLQNIRNHWFLGCHQDEVELSNLQQNGDAAIDVPVHARRLLHLKPKFTHVHVVTPATKVIYQPMCNDVIQ